MPIQVHGSSHAMARLTLSRPRYVQGLWLVALVALIATIVGPISSAWAAAPANDGITPTSNYGEVCSAGLASDTVCQTDNSAVTYYMDSNDGYTLEPADREFVKGAVARYRDATDLTITYDSSPTFSGGGETDVIYQEGDFGFPASTAGVTWCNDPVDGSTVRCDQSYIRMRGQGRINAEVATHETGHSFGLLHGNRWAPQRDTCADVLGIMKSFESCINGPSLGGTVINNINWIY